MVKQSDKPEFIQSFDPSLYPKISKDPGFKMFFTVVQPTYASHGCLVQETSSRSFCTQKIYIERSVFRN